MIAYVDKRNTTIQIELRAISVRQNEIRYKDTFIVPDFLV